MFSGIIQSIGKVSCLEFQNEMGRLTLRTPRDFRGFEQGESIAVNGVCLTVTEDNGNGFSVDLSTETLCKTSFQEITMGSKVNLERSLTPNQKISGHFVLGHVDTVGQIIDIRKNPGEILFRFEHPENLDRHIIEKGSIAIDGISLTVFSCEGHRFSVSIIPFTWEHTNLHARKIDDKVNLECDMIGKYVVKACENILGSAEKASGLTHEFLKENGFR